MTTEGKSARVAYLYLNYKEQNEQTAINLIRSLLRQIVEKESQISSRLSRLYDIFIKKQKQPSIGERTEVLIKEAASLDVLYIVIDAFDESSEMTRARPDLVQELRKIVENAGAQLLITARPMRQAEIDPNRTKTLEIHASVADMRLYLEAQIDREERLSRIIRPDPTLRERIVETIVSKANGMFLAANLHLASLASKNNLAKVRKCLDTIPEDLDDIYNEAMFRIEQQNKDDLQLAKRVLAWITYAYRPLRLRELCQALAIEPEEDTLDSEAMPDAMTLVDICAGLVTIDETSRVIRLVHYTTQDYFYRRRMTRFPDTQKYITSTCLSYLLLQDFRNGCSSSRKELNARRIQFPFLDYAASRWASHFHNAAADGCVDNDLHKSVISLLLNKPSFASACQAKYWEEKHFFSSRVPGASSPLHFAIVHGLSRIAEVLIEKTSDVNTLDPHFRSPLEAAVVLNDQLVVQALLKAGALAHRTNLRGDTTLYHAICQNSTPVVKLLLQKAKNFGMKSTLWHATLKSAIRSQNLSAIKVLQDIVDADISVSTLLHRFLSDAATANELKACRLKGMPDSANVYHLDTAAFRLILFGPGEAQDDKAVVFARVTDSLILFSITLLQGFDDIILSELANSSALILPAGEEGVAQIGLALEDRIGGLPFVLTEETAKTGATSFLSAGLLPSLPGSVDAPFRLMRRLSDYPNEIWCTKFSNNGTKLAIAGKFGGIFIYDTDTYAVSQRLYESEGRDTHSISWSPDDSRILATYDNYAPCIWDVEVDSTLSNLIYVSDPSARNQPRSPFLT
ncbi:hypothetical protein SLS54_009543 [Diplodia seriata]